MFGFCFSPCPSGSASSSRLLRLREVHVLGGEHPNHG
ncbi:hypothetical protein N665_0469s0014 [Sinapis alba]|nr:hypothetical protein N665_0469s0014 [Sinapis alba]